jgi:tetratricopeptide (TPR) repeat protein
MNQKNKSSLHPAGIRQLAPLILVAVAAAFATGAYLQALHYPFIIDDPVYLSANPKLASLPAAGLWRLFTEPYNPAFEFLPLRDLSYWIDIKLFGQDPAGFRLHNLLLYLLCLPFIYGATLGLWRHFRPAEFHDAPWAAAAVTALFALHPALVESVVWISGRKYVLPDMFSMLAIWLAVRAKREQGLSPAYAAAALLAFVAVMLSKSSYVAVAPIIAVIWFLFWRDLPAQSRRRSQLLWPLAIMLEAAILMWVFIAFNQGYDSIPFYFGIEAVYRSLAIPGWLARLAFSPESRHFFYPVFEDASLPFMVALGAAVLAAAAWGLVMMFRRRSLEGFALAAFALCCAPYIQLLPHKLPSLVSDRYLALALWPAMLLLAALAWRLKPAPRALLLLAVALPLGLQTVVRTRDWRSAGAVIDPDLRAYPGYYMPALYKVVTVQLPQGLYREAGETADAISVPEFRAITLKLVKADQAVQTGTGTDPQPAMDLLFQLSRDLMRPPVQAGWNSPINLFWGKALDVVALDWDRLAQRFPDNVAVRYDAALFRLSAYRYQNTVDNLRFVTGSQRLPQAARGGAYRNLGVALLHNGRAAEAEAPLLTALQQSPPDLKAYCVLAQVYRQTGRPGDALRAETGCRDLAPDGGKQH